MAASSVGSSHTSSSGVWPLLLLALTSRLSSLMSCSSDIELADIGRSSVVDPLSSLTPNPTVDFLGLTGDFLELLVFATEVDELEKENETFEGAAFGEPKENEGCAAFGEEPKENAVFAGASTFAEPMFFLLGGGDDFLLAFFTGVLDRGKPQM